MAKDNKIISFDLVQRKRKKSKYNLTAEISVYLCRNIKGYIIDWYSPDDNISEEEIYKILKSIFSKLSSKIPYLKIKKKDYYEIVLTFFYYENSTNKNDFKYICTSQNISDEKLLEYLFTMLIIYEQKKSGAL